MSVICGFFPQKKFLKLPVLAIAWKKSITEVKVELPLEPKEGTWVAQLVKQPTLELTSGHDLKIVRSRPVLGSTLGWSLLAILFLPLPLLSFSISLKQVNKKILILKKLIGSSGEYCMENQNCITLNLKKKRVIQ